MDRNTKVAHSHVLHQVQKAISTQDANFNTLYDMVVLVMPQIKREDMGNKKIRMQAVKELLRQIHPLNFPRDEKAAVTYEGLQHFYERCCESYSTTQYGKENSQPSKALDNNIITSISCDSARDSTRPEFLVGQKWKFLNDYCRPLPPSNNDVTSGKILAPLVAYQCINARGSIVHGRRPSLIYSWDNVKACSGMSVLDIFAKYGGHTVLSDVKSIKTELMRGGPVVSTTFIPDEKIFTRYIGSIIESRKNKYHYCLIVGWATTSHGDVWLIQNYHGDAMIHVPFGRYHVEDIVVCPKSKLETFTWEIGPYYDRDLSTIEGWFEMNSIELLIKTKEMEQFAEVFDGLGLHQILVNKERFVLRDAKQQSKSRSCYLADLSWDRTVKGWRLKCQFTDNANGNGP